MVGRRSLLMPVDSLGRLGVPIFCFCVCLQFDCFLIFMSRQLELQ